MYVKQGKERVKHPRLNPTGFVSLEHHLSSLAGYHAEHTRSSLQRRAILDKTLHNTSTEKHRPLTGQTVDTAS